MIICCARQCVLKEMDAIVQNEKSQENYPGFCDFGSPGRTPFDFAQGKLYKLYMKASGTSCP